MRNQLWAQYVRRKRKLQGFTRRRLAELADIDPSYVTLIERDGYTPRKCKVLDIAKALQCDEHECLLAAGFSDPHIANVYRGAAKAQGLNLAKPLRAQVLKLASLPQSKQASFAKTLQGLLEVVNG